jgi:anti-sigma factor RsiW
MAAVDDLACQELVELVTEYLEEVLPAELRARFEAHLRVCPYCEIYVGQMRLTVRAVQRAHDAGLPERLRGALLQRFREWKDARAG